MTTLQKWGLGLLAMTALPLSAGAAQPSSVFKDAQLDVYALAGGATFFDSGNFPDAGRVYHSRYDLGPKYTFGVAVPYGKLLNIESAVTFGPNNWVVTNTNVSPHVGVVYPMNDYIESASAVLHTPFSRFHIRPYIEAGVEYDQFRPTRAAINYANDYGFASVASFPYLNRNDKFGFNAGGGLDRRLSQRFTFRIDLRDHITTSPRFGLPVRANTYNPVGFAAPGHVHDVTYEVGLIYHIGKL